MPPRFPLPLPRVLAALLFLGSAAARARGDAYPRPPDSCLEAQIALARRDISCGSIDGVRGSKTAAALRAFQEQSRLPPTGRLDDATRARLLLDSPPLSHAAVSPGDLARLQPLSPTWAGKSRQTALDYETSLQLVAERYHASPALIRRLNPNVDWDSLTPADTLTVPAPEHSGPRPKAARLLIRLGAFTVDAVDADDHLLAHFPVSIATHIDKRPLGELHVTVKVSNPDYTADPDNLPDSEEMSNLGHKLILPPGPKNPVGLAWIGLDRPGYGIHGTPEPENIGRPESHGCFRLTNWDAVILLDYVAVGTPVEISP